MVCLTEVSFSSADSAKTYVCENFNFSVILDILCFGHNFHFCIVHHFRLSEVSGGSHIHEAGSKFVYGSDLTW